MSVVLLLVVFGKVSFGAVVKLSVFVCGREWRVEYVVELCSDEREG